MRPVNFYLLDGDKTQGPYSNEQIEVFLKQDLIKRTDLLWAEGWLSWIAVQDIPGIGFKSLIQPEPDDDPLDLDNRPPVPQNTSKSASDGGLTPISNGNTEMPGLETLNQDIQERKIGEKLFVASFCVVLLTLSIISCHYMALAPSPPPVPPTSPPPFVSTNPNLQPNQSP